MGWHRELLIGFDLETTGTDPDEARIVTAAVVEFRGGEAVGGREWLADPGIPIPQDAVAVHGITNARAAADGRPAREVVAEIADVLVAHWRAGTPVVAYNAAFHLSMLAAELRRHGLPSLAERLGRADVGPAVDPYTIDRSVDRYRKGKRTLEAVCGRYGVPLGQRGQPVPARWPRPGSPARSPSGTPRWPGSTCGSCTASRSGGTRNGPPTSSPGCAARAPRTRSWTAPGRCAGHRR